MHHDQVTASGAALQPILVSELILSGFFPCSCLFLFPLRQRNQRCVVREGAFFQILNICEANDQASLESFLLLMSSKETTVPNEILF